MGQSEQALCRLVLGARAASQKHRCIGCQRHSTPACKDQKLFANGLYTHRQQHSTILLPNHLVLQQSLNYETQVTYVTQSNISESVPLVNNMFNTQICTNKRTLLLQHSTISLNRCFRLSVKKREFFRFELHTCENYVNTIFQKLH